MHPRRAPGSGTTLAIAVALAALALTATEVAARYRPETWIQRDGRFYVNVNTTLVEHLSVDQGEFCASWYDGNLGWNRNLDAGWSNVALGRDGEHLPKHPILLPLMSTPLFWAFGLLGALLFNVLCYGVIAAGAFAFARRYASVAAAAFAALALPLATGIRDPTYDYHIDVLMLALFTSALALLYARRGVLAGLILGLDGGAPADGALVDAEHRALGGGAARLADARTRALVRHRPAPSLRRREHLALRSALVERLQPRAGHGERRAADRRRQRRVLGAFRAKACGTSGAAPTASSTGSR